MIRHMCEHMLQAPGFIPDLLRLDTCMKICFKPQLGFIIHLLRLDTCMYATSPRIHTGSFKIRHMCVCYKPELGFILDLLRLDTCVNICYKTQDSYLIF